MDLTYGSFKNWGWDLQNNHGISCQNYVGKDSEKPLYDSTISNYMWRCPKMLVPPVIINFNRIFHYKSTFLGYPHLWKPPWDDAWYIIWFVHFQLYYGTSFLDVHQPGHFALPSLGPLLFEGFPKWGHPIRWMVYLMENPYKWMMSGGTPIWYITLGKTTTHTHKTRPAMVNSPLMLTALAPFRWVPATGRPLRSYPLDAAHAAKPLVAGGTVHDFSLRMDRVPQQKGFFLQHSLEIEWLGAPPQSPAEICWVWWFECEHIIT